MITSILRAKWFFPRRNCAKWARVSKQAQNTSLTHSVALTTDTDITHSYQNVPRILESARVPTFASQNPKESHCVFFERAAHGRKHNAKMREPVLKSRSIFAMSHCQTFIFFDAERRAQTKIKGSFLEAPKGAIATGKVGQKEPIPSFGGGPQVQSYRPTGRSGNADQRAALVNCLGPLTGTPHSQNFSCSLFDSPPASPGQDVADQRGAGWPSIPRGEVFRVSCLMLRTGNGMPLDRYQRKIEKLALRMPTSARTRRFPSSGCSRRAELTT